MKAALVCQHWLPWYVQLHPVVSCGDARCNFSLFPIQKWQKAAYCNSRIQMCSSATAQMLWLSVHSVYLYLSISLIPCPLMGTSTQGVASAEVSPAVHQINILPKGVSSCSVIFLSSLSFSSHPRFTACLFTVILQFFLFLPQFQLTKYLIIQSSCLSSSLLFIGCHCSVLYVEVFFRHTSVNNID